METLLNRFTYHAPGNGAEVAQHATVRKELLEIAELFQAMLPQGRELSLVLTKLEETMFWANAALARSRAPAQEHS